MPQNTKLAAEQWDRYVYVREQGHLEYVRKSRICENYFAGYPGLQWDPSVLAELRDQRRPGLTINKVLSTISNIMGEQIDLRTEIAFKARYGAPSGNADTLTKLFRFIGDQNQLGWVRSEMFADGAITSRGFVDVRLDFDNNASGEVRITNMNPRNVMPDPDAHDYDPDLWNDIIVTKWFTADQIKYMYNEADSKLLSARGESVWNDGFDSIDHLRDRFGGESTLTAVTDEPDPSVQRMIRVIDRQYRKLDKMKYFINIRTGDRKKIPHTWDTKRIAEVLAAAKGLLVVDEHVGTRIRWTVTADDVVLHDDWSPYEHFTIVPYFPYFRHGRTIGLVENLIDVQDLLNKTTSQELHVVNTTANSGWKIKANALKNMSTDELEQYGAKSGLVMELDDIGNAEKIQPNQIPQGLDRLSQKAESYIKSVSARGDAQMGMARADTSAVQIEASNQYGDMGLKKPLDNLARSDWFLARVVLSCVQEFYTDPRIAMVTNNDLTGEQSEIKINWPNPETGEIDGDISQGEYEAQVINQPAKATLEDSQFEQGAFMREKLGIPIPDEFLIENSRLINKTAIVQALKAEKNSAVAQEREQLKLTAAKLEVAQLKAEATRLEADALLKRAKSAETIAKTQNEAAGDPTAEAEMQLKERQHQQDMVHDKQKHDQTMQMDREKHAMTMELERKKGEEDVRRKRAEAIVAARADPNKQGKPQSKGAKAA